MTKHVLILYHVKLRGIRKGGLFVQQLNGLIPTLVSSIPIWSILLFYVYRSIKNRDSFEERIASTLRKFNGTMHSHTTALALLKNELENIKETIKSINLSAPHIEKFKTDLDLYYKRLRDLEKTVDV